MVVTRSVRNGEIERLSRGLYRHKNSPISAHQDMLEVSAQSPKAVMVLITALRFHELGTQAAYEVWIQLPTGTRHPKATYPPRRIVYTSIPDLISEGVKEYNIDGRIVPITTPARTVADCFKYRNLIGLEPCIEALRELIQRDRNCVDTIHYFAKLNRVQKVILPYLEAIV